MNDGENYLNHAVLNVYSFQLVEYKKINRSNCYCFFFRFKDILTTIDSVIYIDTDILFLSNVRSLWRFFRKFNSTQLAALTPEHEDPSMGWYNRFARHPYYGAMGKLNNKLARNI